MRRVNVIKKSMLKNALFSFIKTFFAFVFPLITYPYVARVLTVDDLGRISFGNSIIGYFSLLSTFGLTEFAVRNGSQIRKNKRKLNIFANRIFTLNFLFTLFSYVILFIVILLPTKIGLYKDIILLQSITLALGPFAVEWLFNILEDFKFITIRTILIQTISAVLLFTIVRDAEDVYKYILILVFAGSVGNIFNFFYSKKYFKIKLTKKTHWSRYKKSVLLFFMNSMTSTIYLNSDVTILGVFCTDYAVGLYGAATKIYSLAKQVFNAVVLTVVPRLAYMAANAEDEFYNLAKKIISVAIIFVSPTAIGVLLLSNDVIVLISGEKYADAASALSILSIGIVFAVLANIFANGILVSLHKENKVVRATFLSAIVNIVLNMFLIPIFQQNAAALTTLIAEVVMFISCMFYMRKHLKKLIDLKEFIQAIFANICMVLGFLLITAFCDNFGWNRWAMMVIKISSCIMIYFIALFIQRNTIILSGIQLLAKRKKN